MKVAKWVILVMTSSNNNKGNQKSDSITDSSIAELFEGKNFAFFATLMKEGTPHVTPTWVDVDKSNNTILINTAKDRVKHKNTSRDPRVGVSVIHSSNPYHMVSVRGKVIEQINGKEADDHIDKMTKNTWARTSI